MAALLENDQLAYGNTGRNISYLIPSFNGTQVGNEEHWRTILDRAAVIIMTVNLIILMFGMGAATSIWDVWESVKRPWACLIGMACQFFALPAFGYAISIVLNLPPYESLGVLILTCSPGGALSVLFTYWVDGDIALSILMTTTSCLLAFGAMPLNLWIYTRFWTDEEMKIPYLKVLASMAFVTGPTLLGMAFRHFSKKWATIIAQVCSILGWAGGLACGAFVVIIYWEVIATTSLNLVIAAGVVPVFGFVISYICVKIFCMKHHIGRTVGIEIGCQNIVVATSVALISFTNKLIRGKMIVFPALYGMFQLGEVLLFIIFFQFYKFIHRDDVTEEIVKNVIDTKVLQMVPLPNPRSNSREPATQNGMYIQKQENVDLLQASNGVYSSIKTKSEEEEIDHLYNESGIYEGSITDQEDSKELLHAETTISDEVAESDTASRISLQTTNSVSSLVTHQTDTTTGQSEMQETFPRVRAIRTPRNEQVDWPYEDPDNTSYTPGPPQMDSDHGPNPRHHWDPYMSDLIHQRNRQRNMGPYLSLPHPVTYHYNRWRNQNYSQGRFYHYEYEDDQPDTPRSPSHNEGYQFRTFYE